ncbi:MAG TPA: ribosomal protein S18-alanine N-acetyltransferase [Acidimicrobiales bacterium]|nr:ribosomal protein S18-alanine N-acetyltransferase [Acidimicrobiales bacterium]
MAARVDEELYRSPGVVLVPMRRRHLRGVLRIEAQVYPRPWSLRLFMSELALRATRTYTVALVDGLVAGYSGLMVTGEDAHVTTLAVDPRWHRHGIGSRLLLRMARAAVAQGARHLTLEVRMSNEPAKKLYGRFGFAPAGVRKNYYVETNEDALVMWANDIDSSEYRARLADIEAKIPRVDAAAGPPAPALPRRPVPATDEPSAPEGGRP